MKIKSTKGKRIRLLNILFLLLLIYSTTYSAAKVAFIGPLSGKYKYQGQEILNGINEVFQLEKNKDLFEFKIFDNEGSPIKTIEIMQEIVQDDTFCLSIGPLLEQNALLSAEIASKSNLPLILPVSINAKNTADKKTVYRIPYIEEESGKALADFAFFSLEKRNVILIRDLDSDYSLLNIDKFKNRFNKYSNTTIVEADTIEEISFDSNSVVFISSPKQLEGMIKRVSVFEKKPIILGTSEWKNTEILEMLNNYKGEVYITSHYSTGINDADSRLFLENYFDKYSVPASELSVFGYDTMGLVVSILKSIEEVSKENVANYLQKMSKYKGISGIFRFDEGGNPEKTVHILNYIEGEFEYYQSINPDFMGQSLKIIGKSKAISEESLKKNKVSKVINYFVILGSIVVIVIILKKK